jgi:hypothetical protein
MSMDDDVGGGCWFITVLIGRFPLLLLLAAIA